MKFTTKPIVIKYRAAYDIIDHKWQRDILKGERVDVSQVWAWREFDPKGLEGKLRVEVKG